MRINVGDEEIYSFFDKSEDDYGGAYVHFARLPDNSSSNKITITLYSPSSNPFSRIILPISIGSKGYLLKNSFHNTIESLFFGIFLIVFGLVFLGNILLFNRSLNNYYLLSLSLLLVCFGSWVLFQSNAKQLIGITNPNLPMQISFFSMFSLPICLWFYISSNYKKIGEYKILKYFSFSILSLYIPIFIVTLFDVPYTNFLSLIGLLILVFSILVFIISIKVYRSGEKSIVSCSIAMFGIIQSVILDETLLILRIKISNIPLIHFGIGLAAIVFFYKSIGNLIEKNTETSNAKLLKKLAYLDVVTLVQNRNAYELFLEKNANSISNIGIILADVNCLKYVNDKNGHKSGDALLKRMSKELKSILPPESDIYRIGGDEFIAILKDFTKEDFLLFSKTLKEKFIPKMQNFGMAIGTHYYTKEKDETLSNGIELADFDMYSEKKNHKQQINMNYLEFGIPEDISCMREN